MEEQTKSNSKPTKNNKKIKIIFLILLFIIIAIVVFFLIYNNIKMYKQQKYIDTREEMMKVPSGLHMLIAEETYDTKYDESLKDKKTIYYFIIDENEICQACFAELVNMEVVPYPGNGFINPRKVGNNTYTEMPSFRGSTLEELKIIYNRAPYTKILAEW